MTRGTGVLTMAASVVLAWAGLAIHDAFEVPQLLPGDPQFTIPTAIYVILGAAWILCRGLLTVALLTAWSVLNIVAGGFLSVLPLPWLPFAPGQTLEHYLVHVVYALAQVPLLILLLRTGRRHTWSRPDE